MVDFPFYQEHANGGVSKIQGKVGNIHVRFANSDAAVDFIILESTSQGNIVLGRTFLRAMKCFIDVGKGLIQFCRNSRGKYIFPRRKKQELIEEPFSNFDDP